MHSEFASFEDLVKEKYPNIPVDQTYNFLEIVVTEAERTLASLGTRAYGDLAGATFGSPGWDEKNQKVREAYNCIWQALGHGDDPRNYPKELIIPSICEAGIFDWETFMLPITGDQNLDARVKALKPNYDRSHRPKSPWLE